MNYVKHNRAKVIILSTLFVAALIHRFGVIDRILAEEAVAEQASPTNAPVAAKAEQSGVVNLRHFNWPDSDLESLLTYSPFGIEQAPEPTPDEEAENAAEEGLIEQAQQPVPEEAVEARTYITQRLKAVSQTENGPAAMVGSRIVHVGDRLEDGSRIVAIRNRELILEPQSPTAETQQ